MRQVLVFLLLILGLVCAAGAAAPYRIMMITWRGCEEACQGFQDQLRQQRIKAEITLRDAAQKREALPGFLAEARNGKIDLIVTWGTSVTRDIAGTLKELGDPRFNHEIPQVFMIVADPVGAGIIDTLDRTGRPNVTGTYNRVPEEVNIETIRTYLPSFKRLGLLYHADEPNSVLKRDELRVLAQPMGFELVAIELPPGPGGKPRVEDLAPKLAELKAAGIDFLYLGSSSFLQREGATVTAEAVAQGIAVLSPYEQLVRDSMALMSVAPRYADVGRLAAEQAAKILVERRPPGTLPVARMTEFAVVINMSVAKKLKRFPPLALVQVAETVE